MSEEIIKVLDNLAQKFGIAIDWTNQNILPYLQDLMGRYISLQNSYAIVWIVISIIMIIGSIILIRICIKATKKTNNFDDELLIAVGIMLSLISIIIFVVVLFVNIFSLLQNIITPEITILEYLKTINLGA